MTRDDIDEFIGTVVSEEEAEVIVPDELDGAFVGIAGEDSSPRAVYSIEKSIKILMEDGMSEEEATEYFWYNVAGTKGDNMPLFINTPNIDRSSWTISSPYAS